MQMMKKEKNTRKYGALCFACFFILLFDLGKAFGGEVFTVSPWLSMVTRFIGGVYVTVRPIYVWNDDGDVIRKIRTQNIPKNSRIITLDVKEAVSLGLNEKQYPWLFLLYRTAPFDTSRSDYYFSDPSVLPFIAQRVLTALAQFDPVNYPYFQRRLSEFQTRLDSTVLVGRQLLRGYPVFDLTGSFSNLFLAAGCKLFPKDRARRTLWEKGEDSDGLVKAVEEALKNRIPVVLDVPSAKTVRNALKSNKDVLFLGRPRQDQDVLLFFHDQYLLLWNRLAPLRQKQENS